MSNYRTDVRCRLIAELMKLSTCLRFAQWIIATLSISRRASVCCAIPASGYYVRRLRTTFVGLSFAVFDIRVLSVFCMCQLAWSFTFILVALIHPATPMHRATRWPHECMSWADVSTCSQVNPILWKSFPTSLQFILGLAGFLMNPLTSQCSACFGMRNSFILVTLPSHPYFSDHFLILVTTIKINE